MIHPRGLTNLLIRPRNFPLKNGNLAYNRFGIDFLHHFTTYSNMSPSSLQELQSKIKIYRKEIS